MDNGQLVSNIGPCLNAHSRNNKITRFVQRSADKLSSFHTYTTCSIDYNQSRSQRFISIMCFVHWGIHIYYFIQLLGMYIIKKKYIKIFMFTCWTY